MYYISIFSIYQLVNKLLYKHQICASQKLLSTHITLSSSTYIQYFTQVYTKDASPNYGVSLGWSSHVFAFEFPMCAALTGANSPLVLCWLMQASSLFGRSLIGVSGAVKGNTFHC